MSKSVRLLVSEAEDRNNEAISMLEKAESLDMSEFDGIKDLIKEALAELYFNKDILW